MIVGGFPYEHDVELIDISGQNLSCPFLPNYPVESGMVGVFINEKALLCGGYNSIGIGKCFSITSTAVGVSYDCN